MFAPGAVTMILNLSESLAKLLVMAKLNIAYLSSLKNEQHCCCPHCWCHHLGYSVPPFLSSLKHEQNCYCPYCQCHHLGYSSPPFLSSLKNEQNWCCPHCRCHHLGYSVPRAHHCTIWCRSNFEPRGPSLSIPTSFLRPALKMAPTTDNNARDEQSVLRLNPATFSRASSRIWNTVFFHLYFSI